MVVDESIASWPAALREDWGIEHLVEALKLGEGFGFHILSCDTPRTTRAILRYLEHAVDRRLRALHPSEDRAVGQPVTTGELFSTVLEPLAAPIDPALGPWMLAIDASGAQVQDEPAWRELFRRMNERRNGIVRHLDVPLLLCVSPRIEVAFAQEAPDFWSIRSSRVDVPLLPVETLPAETPEIEERAFRWPAFAFDGERVRQEIARARREVEGKPGNANAMTALSVWLGRLGRLAAERSDLQQAVAAFEEALRIRNALSEQDPENLAKQAAYAVSLMDLGFVERQGLGLERAQALYESARDVLRRLLEREPDHPEWRSNLASSYHQLGVLAQDRGELSQAQECYQKSLRIKEELGNRAGLASSYHQLGILAQDRGELAEAQEWYQKSLRIIEELGDRAGLGKSYHQLGRLAQARGELVEAQEWYQKSLGISEELGDRAGMARTSSQLGVLATERGQPAEGLRLNLQSLAIRLRHGSPEIRINLHWLRRQRELIGEARFGEILRENLDANATTAVLGRMEENGGAE